MSIYFDMNVYNRMFDDQTQLRIRFESMAIDIICELIEMGQYTLFWSFILEYENDKNPFINRRDYIKSLSALCVGNIEPNKAIKEIAKEIINNLNAKAKDALHLACAIYKKCDYFITCDDKFIKTINKHSDNLSNILGKIKLLNPIDFLRMEVDINVIEWKNKIYW